MAIAAWRCAGARRPTLVITDIVMPEKEGLELIRDLSREMPDVAILAMTGAGNPGVYLRAAGLFGAVALLSKPFDPDELLCAVEAALQRMADPCRTRSGRRCSTRRHSATARRRGTIERSTSTRRRIAIPRDQATPCFLNQASIWFHASLASSAR